MVTSQTLYIGTRVVPKIKNAIEKVVPDTYVSIALFVQEAVYEKLKREGLL